MKRFLLLTSIWCPIIAITACSTDTGTTTGGTGGLAPTTGGVTGTTGGTTATTGGTTATTGGTSATTGGTTGTTGGATGTTGGSTSSTGGSGGAGQGGSSVSGTTSTGGTTGGGTATGGTSSGGTAGKGTGGSSTGGAQGGGGAGGTSGTTGGSAGAGGTSDLVTAVAGKFDGYLFAAPCADKGTGYDCTNSGCSGSTKTVMQTFTLGGTMGQAYTMSIHVYGIAEGKNYTGGTRRAGGTDYTGDTGGDFLYTGGTVPNSTYNSYELHVRNPGSTTDTAVYYLNAINGSEQHSSFALSFDVTMMVQGGGSILFRTYDSNCRQIMNCGAGTGSSTCAKPRTIDISAATPAPANFTQPYVGGAPSNATGQWLLIDVKSVN